VAARRHPRRQAQNETFSAGSDEQTAARAEGFKQMVMAAGEYWPDGWIKGRGFVRESGPAQDVPVPARSFHDVGLDYVNQARDRSLERLRIDSDRQVQWDRLSNPHERQRPAVEQEREHVRRVIARRPIGNDLAFTEYPREEGAGSLGIRRGDTHMVDGSAHT
jgi:hypothetical protein